MASRTVTFSLNGDIPLDKFAEAVNDFQRLVRELTREIGRKTPIRWTLADLEFGSAYMSFVGESEAAEVVDRVARAYVTVGQALQQGKPIPYSSSVAKAAQALADLVDDQVTSIEFRADDEHATILATTTTVRPTLLGAYGAVSGQVETLRMRGGLRFTLYDDLFDHPVRCYLRVGQEDLMRDAWGRSAIVEGWVERNSLTGAPMSIADIVSVQIIPEQESGFWQARGVLGREPDESLPEERVRMVRDA